MKKFILCGSDYGYVMEPQVFGEFEEAWMEMLVEFCKAIFKKQNISNSDIDNAEDMLIAYYDADKNISCCYDEGLWEFGHTSFRVENKEQEIMYEIFKVEM